MFRKELNRLTASGNYAFILIVILALNTQTLFAQSIGELPPFTKWHQNPLGFNPVSLHTSNAITLPVLAAAACLILTERDSALTERLSFYNESGLSFGYYASETTIFRNNTGLLFQRGNWLSFGAEVGIYTFKDDVNSTWGYSIRPFFRWYPYSDGYLNLYFESGAGLIWIFDNFPKPSGFFGDYRTGTHFNGISKYGIGAEINLTQQFLLMVGIRHVHISNGDIFNKSRNPAHDGNGFSIGIIYQQ